MGSRVKKTYGYQKRDEVKRLLFKEEIALSVPQELVYIDEYGMDSREDYSYGWNAKGSRFYALKSGLRPGRVNMIAASGNGELLAPFTVEGSGNRTLFETRLETCLIPTLKPGKIVMADHATFHKGGRIIQLIEAAGCQLKYLPPYSPALNKIERCWSWLKSRIRKQLIQFDCRAGCHGSCASRSGLIAKAIAILPPGSNNEKGKSDRPSPFS